MGDLMERGVLQGHTGCEDCGSSDGLAIYYKDSKGYDGCCWAGCRRDHKTKETLQEWGILDEDYELVGLEKRRGFTVNDITVDEELKGKLDKVLLETEIATWKSRKIKKEASNRYGVRTKFSKDDDDKVHLRYYPTTYNGELVGYHVRNDIVKQAKKVDKTVEGFPFWPLGFVRTECEMFGQSLFAKGGKYIVITGGEEDALAVWTALKSDSYETPVISPVIGETSAAKQIQANYQYINSFEHIVLMMDNDTAGKEAVREISKLFGYGKVLVADLIHKDPCEFLQKMPYDAANKAIKKAFWDAVPKKPSQVLTVHDIFKKAMTPPEMGLSMPWPSATKATLGIRKGEIHIVGAAPKIG